MRPSPAPATLGTSSGRNQSGSAARLLADLDGTPHTGVANPAKTGNDFMLVATWLLNTFLINHYSTISVNILFQASYFIF